MSEHSLCPELNANTLLVLEAQKIVRWAATPIEPGESIGAQINKASRELRLPHGIVWRAWYGRAGAEIYPTIYEARCELLERRQAEQSRKQSPWQLDGHSICPIPQRAAKPVVPSGRLLPKRRHAQPGRISYARPASPRLPSH